MNNNNSDRPPLILVVDDDRTMRSLLNLAIEEEGFRVVEAENGSQCLAEYTHFQPDLILLDAIMPDIDGFTCCQKIRSLPGGDRVPILMITVLDDQESVEQAFNSGATDYITKPIHWSVLSQRVRRLLAGNQVWSELAVTEAKLAQQKTWEELVRNILKKSTEDCPLRDSVWQILTIIREWLQATRILLCQVYEPNFIEAVAVEYASIKNFSLTEVNLIAEYGEHYQKGETILIEDVTQSKLPVSLIEQFKQLKTQGLSVIPLKKNEQLSLFVIHFPQIVSQDQLLLERLLDLGRLLNLIVT